jgi:hypothetical protein
MVLLLSFRGVLIAAAVAFVACTVVAVNGSTSPSPSQLKTCGNNNNNNNNVLFGIRSDSKKLASASSIDLINGISRGGELHAPSTLKEVNDLVTQAGIQNKLVVIDFTARYVSFRFVLFYLYSIYEHKNKYDFSLTNDSSHI